MLFESVKIKQLCTDNYHLNLFNNMQSIKLRSSLGEYCAHQTNQKYLRVLLFIRMFVVVVF